ncbi:imelysin family protein [Aureimonas sp. AU12]|uniref:imelysin family protein n=1 Tax=Aureimonas sp. AU12 TaxID=1638161 RepID=UPI00078602A6|nr:imelysin family protein [Aureimonas sp. AU12]
MRLLFSLPMLAFALAASAPALAVAPETRPATTREEVVRRAVEDVIRPGYDALAKASADAAETTAALCAAPSPAALDAVRLRFGDLARAFGAIEFVRFGPIAQDNRIERFLFWPDRRGVALRQVGEILARQDAAAVDPDGLHAKSVAVQGLTALEALLFGTGSDDLATPAGDFRCRYARGVAANLRDMAANVAVEWKAADGIGRRLIQPSAADPNYRTANDALQEILGTAIHGLEAVRDLRILPGIGKSVAEAKPGLFLFHRSDLDAAVLQADLDGLSALMLGSGLFDILPEDSSWVPASVTLEFETLRSSLATLTPTPADAAATPNGHGTLQAMVLEIRGIESTLATEVAPALGVSAGFSSLDGD